MNINTFLTLYKNKLKNGGAEDFVKEHIKNIYIPYEQKIAAANAIVNVSYWNSDEESTKKFHVDSTAKYMLTCMTMLDLYTDIERSKSNGEMLSDFNKLNEYGIFDIIVSNINKREIQEFNMVLQMLCDDIIANEYELHSFISNQVERFGAVLGSIIGPALENIDINKISETVTGMINNSAE